jgi:hypothetical protein
MPFTVCRHFQKHYRIYGALAPTEACPISSVYCNYPAIVVDMLR